MVATQIRAGGKSRLDPTLVDLAARTWAVVHTVGDPNVIGSKVPTAPKFRRSCDFTRLSPTRGTRSPVRTRRSTLLAPRQGSEDDHSLRGTPDPVRAQCLRSIRAATLLRTLAPSNGWRQEE